MRRIVLLLVATLSFSGCAAFILANIGDYTGAVEALMSRIGSAAGEARRASQARDGEALDRAIASIQMSCSALQPYLGFAEQAITSSVAQDSSRNVNAALERQSWERACLVDDSEPRLELEKELLARQEESLVEHCGCPEPIDGEMIDISQCYATDLETNLSPLGGIVAPFIPAFNVGGAIGTAIKIISGRPSLAAQCYSLKKYYRRQYPHTAAVERICGDEPDDRQTYMNSGQDLADRVEKYINRAKVGDTWSGEGGVLYHQTYEGLRYCESLLASVGADARLMGGFETLATDYDQEPGGPGYTPPFEEDPLIPPPPPPPPPGEG